MPGDGHLCHCWPCPICHHGGQSWNFHSDVKQRSEPSQATSSASRAIPKEFELPTPSPVQGARLDPVQPGFKKPVDPQWSCQSGGFIWTQKQHVNKMLTVGEFNKDGSGSDKQHNMDIKMSPVPLFQVKNQHNKRLCSRALESTSENRCWDKKSKIFLSHAGAQKDFVEQLYIDLLRIYHFGIFFDKDEDSLPKGEAFPQLILDAAKHCELCIVIMSHEYFTRKWPLLELKTFIEAQKTRPELKILPIFYKLSIDEFKQSKRQAFYRKNWNQVSSNSMWKEANCQWEEASKVICSTNGIQFQSSEVALRNEIVKAAFKLVVPYLLSDDSHVQGKMRIAEVIEESFFESNNRLNTIEIRNVSFVGLYGVGGIGKTTMSKVLCNKLSQNFFGKVCHIEFGVHDFLHFCKKLIQCTSSYEEMFLNTQVLDNEKAMNLLKTIIPNQKMFLVIDNVDQTSIDEAKVFVNLPFKEGSLILVTARSIITLEKLNITWRKCMRVPTLQKDEALALLSYYARCDLLNLLEVNKKQLDNFVDNCCFNVEDGNLQEYHPLALKVLGTRIGPDPREWHKIVIDFKDATIETKHPIFSILRSSYDALELQVYQRMFMDLILGRNNIGHPLNCFDLTWRLRYLYGEKSYKFTFELLKMFQAKSLIEYYDFYSGEIHVHDLYREFVQMEVQRERFYHYRKCCLFREINQSCKQLQRLHIYKQKLPHLDKEMLCTCSESELLTIEDCLELKSINIQGMQNLKMIEILGCPQLKIVLLKDLINLQCIIWKNFEGEYPSLVGLNSLEGLFFLSNDKVFDGSSKTCHLDISNRFHLDVLSLWNQPLLPKFLDFNFLSNLTILNMNNCNCFKSFLNLQLLAKLVSLELLDCFNLLEFPSLANFRLLEVFTLDGASQLKKLRGFEYLTVLEFLSLKDAKELQGLPGIEVCTKLVVLNLSSTWAIQDFSWISVLFDLTKVNLSGTRLNLIPDCSKLYKLQELHLNNCPNLEGFESNYGPYMGESLTTISMANCLSLKAWPLINGPILTHINITNSSVIDISGIEHYLHLQYLDCAYTYITSFPDLSNLWGLKRLNVRGCLKLTRLDNIKNLPALEELFVQDCKNLVALPNLQSSKYLIELDLKNCPLVDPNLVKLPSCRSDTILKNSTSKVQMEETEFDNVEMSIIPVKRVRTRWERIMEAMVVPIQWLQP